MHITTRPQSGVNRPCQVCGEPARKTLVYSQRFTTPSRNAIHNGYDVVICGLCGFAFADQAPSQGALDQYYHAMAKKDEMLDASTGYLESPETVARNTHSAAQIKSIIARGNRVLDIGCYTGYLLSLILKEFPQCSAVGVDPSSFAAAVGKRRHGIDIRVGTIFELLDLGQFDVVICSHVLEHLADLRPFLARLRSLLLPGGKLYVEVPDATRFDSGIFNAAQRAEPFFEFNFEHINYFSTTSLRNLFELNGFEAIAISTGVSTLPVISSAWSGKPITRSTESADALKQYVKHSAEKNNRVADVVRQLTTRTPAYIVWGAGAHTQRLLAENVIEAGRVEFFVDVNPDLQGATLAGRPICPPDALKTNPQLPVLISSYRHERDIMTRLLADKVPNEIVPMYAWIDPETSSAGERGS